MVSVQKIWHRNQFRIGISFGFDENLKQKARQIGARWSQIYKCWYMDYNKENYQKITTTFPETEILYNTSTEPETPAPGLKRGHDIAPITVRIKPGSALRSSQEAEHKVKSIEKGEKKAAFWVANKNTMSDGINQGTGTTNRNAKLVPCAVDFISTGICKTKFEIETIKSDKFVVIFTS
jgi:hypothetical protein